MKRLRFALMNVDIDSMRRERERETRLLGIWDCSDLEGAMNYLRDHMQRAYGMNLDDLEIAETPGYWRDRHPKMHPRHPLHGCLFCDGPFRATYTYYDPPRDRRGRFASPTRTWRQMKEANRCID